MHVTPFSHTFDAVKIVIGHVYSTYITNFAVNDDNLAVIAREMI
jgi:hypothetical protein